MFYGINAKGDTTYTYGGDYERASGERSLAGTGVRRVSSMPTAPYRKEMKKVTRIFIQLSGAHAIGVYNEKNSLQICQTLCCNGK